MFKSSKKHSKYCRICPTRTATSHPKWLVLTNYTTYSLLFFKRSTNWTTTIYFVGMKGLEPLRTEARHPKCRMSTSSITFRFWKFRRLLTTVLAEWFSQHQVYDSDFNGNRYAAPPDLELPGFFQNRRRVRDSNPRALLRANGFQDRRNRPLCQPSIYYFWENDGIWTHGPHSHNVIFYQLNYILHIYLKYIYTNIVPKKKNPPSFFIKPEDIFIFYVRYILPFIRILHYTTIEPKIERFGIRIICML